METLLGVEWKVQGATRLSKALDDRAYCFDPGGDREFTEWWNDMVTLSHFSG